jgi:hypothetical protein
VASLLNAIFYVFDSVSTADVIMIVLFFMFVCEMLHWRRRRQLQDSGALNSLYIGFKTTVVTRDHRRPINTAFMTIYKHLN